MQITIRGDIGGVDNRTRAYAEYRVFEALRRFGRRIQHVEIELRSTSPSSGSNRTAGTVTIRMMTGEVATAEAVADWPYAAIDRAVGRAAEQLVARPMIAAAP
jgi:ribosome-associated translation inhibitor RaiA